MKVNQSGNSSALEFWDAGGQECYLYTEQWAIAKELREELGRYAAYIRNGRAYAWQFKIRKQRLRWMQIRFQNQSSPISQNPISLALK